MRALHHWKQLFSIFLQISVQNTVFLLSRCLYKLFFQKYFWISPPSSLIRGDLKRLFSPSRFRRGSPEGRGEGFSKAPFGGWGTSRPTVYGGIINLYDEELKGANKALMHPVSSSKKQIKALLPNLKMLISFLDVMNTFFYFIYIVINKISCEYS